MQPVLGSWKEIANYLGKGVRTVQRWERHSGLPVHRPSGSSKGVVLAFPAELDKWARRQDAKGCSFTETTVHRNTTLSMELANRTRELCQSTEKLMLNAAAFVELARRRRAAEAGGADQSTVAGK